MGAEIGVYYIHIAPEMKGFTSEVRSALGELGTSAGKTVSNSFVDVLKGSAIGTMLGSLTSKLAGEIAGSFDIGVKRIDTLENFPKVMSALGYSTEEASKSVETIMKHLDGLPTTTQDMVTLTKAIADSTGDLDLATRAALGFNDMMLANGASQGEMTQAMGVFNRVLGKQNATVAQWQSLQSVMPAQLAMVARELQGEGASVEGLRDALNDGTISWNDFLQAIVKLDKDGTIDSTGKQIASFTDQAIANSHGIETSLVNIPNRIGQGWAEILKVIGREDISKTIDKFSYGIRDAMTAVAGGIAYLKEKIGDTAIFENLSTIFGRMSEVLGGLGGEAASGLKAIADGLIELTAGALQWLADHGDMVTTVTWGLLGALSALAGWQIGTGLAALPGVLTGIWTVIMANPFGILVTAITVAIAALYGFFTQTEKGREIWQKVSKILSDLWSGLKQDFTSLVETVRQRMEESAAQWQVFVNNVTGFVNNLWTNIKNIFFSIVSDVLLAFADIKRNLDDNKVQWELFKTNVVATVTNLENNVIQKFADIRDGIIEKIQWAKDKVSGIIDDIKGLFNFSWSLPAPKLPHINWHWNEIGGLLSIPVFDGISWYAQGGVFNAPTIVGLGEAGDEAALPLNDAVYQRIAKGIAEQGGGGPTINVYITDNELNMRDEDDIERIGDAIALRIAREMGAAA